MKKEITGLTELINNLKKELEYQYGLAHSGSSSGKRLTLTSTKSSHYAELMTQIEGIKTSESRHSVNLPHINQATSKNQTNQTESQVPEKEIQPSLKPIVYKTEKIEALYSAEPSIMFTRLDAERNTKRLRRAITRGYLTDQIYEVNSKF
jgi:hypothetical protein